MLTITADHGARTRPSHGGTAEDGLIKSRAVWRAWRRLSLRGLVLIPLALVFLMASASLASADTDTITATEGTQFSGVVYQHSSDATAYLYCPTENRVCSDLEPTATIAWGDGITSAATLQPDGACYDGLIGCRYIISGAHTYTSYGTYVGTVTLTDANSSDPPQTDTPSFTATVADAALSLSNGSIARNGQTATLTATLTDQNPDPDGCQYEVSIDWGDGTGSQPGTVVNNGCELQVRRGGSDFARASLSPDAATATFTVTGTHTYATGEPTSDQASVTVSDGGGSTATLPITIPFPPTTQTLAASLIGANSATLNASIDTNGGVFQSCEFKWGKTTAYGNTAPCSGVTEQQQTVSAALTGLSVNTAYHYEVVVTTSVGTVDGGDVSFTTLASVAAGAPTVTTGGAEVTGATSAAIGGSVNPNGFTLSDCHFEWGTTTAYGSTAPCTPSSSLSGNTSISVQATLSGLSPDTTYHYRLVAANPDAPASAGADATFATQPNCNVDATFGYVEATGCLSHTTEQYVSTPGSTVSLDGLTMVPDYDWVTITIDPAAGTMSSSGPVSVDATGSGTGTVVIYNGQFFWTEPNPDDGNTVVIGSVTPPPLTKVAGITLDGDFSLSFDKQDDAIITGNAQLPFGPLSGTSILDGTLQLKTVPGTGLVTNALQITSSGLELKGIGVKNLKVIYQPSTDTWSGSATIDLPTPNQLSISASLAFQHGSFQEFSGSVDNLNVPLWAGVDLQRISVEFGVDPTVIGGGLGLSFGPQVQGKQLARVDGDFVYQAATSTAAGFIDVDGSLTLASFKIADAYFDYYTTGLVDFGGGVQLGLPNLSAPDPQKQPVYFAATLNGALEGTAFDVDVNTSVKLNFIDLTVGAEVLISDKGLAACAHLSAFGFGWSPGFGYDWGGGLSLMWSGCSVGPWETLNVGQATASSVGREINVRSGSSLLRLKGVSGAPKATLRGPGGQHVSVPLNSVKPLKQPGFMVLQDPADSITWIAIQHGGGAWRMTPEGSQSGITSIRDAPLLPNPKVTGHVSGKGRARTLTWNLRAIPGQRVTFWEKGKDVARIIGSTTKPHGVLHFTSAPGYSRYRTIEAQVYSYGHPRTDVTVTHYKSPGAPRPGKVSKLKLTAAKGGAIKVTWSRAALAQRYRMEVDTNGSHITELAAGTAHSIVIHDAVPIETATVNVTGELSDGVGGPTVKSKFPQPKAKPKPKPKPTSGKSK
jgi:hypothetical protein